MGGIGGGVLVSAVSPNVIITAPAVVPTSAGTVLAWTGRSFCSGATSAVVSGIKITGGPPVAASTIWCVPISGRGAPIATTTGGGAEALIWTVGAEGDGHLYAIDAVTGQTVFAGGQVEMSRFNAPIVAKGRIYVAGNNGAYAFTVR